MSAASHFSACRRGGLRPAVLPPRTIPRRLRPHPSVAFRLSCSSSSDSSSSSDNGDPYSYLDMWRKAMERERMSQDFHRLAERELPDEGEAPRGKEGGESLERMTEEFNRILEVPREERDRAQRLQMIDRAAAAIAAARALIKESLPPAKLSAADAAVSAVGSRSPAEYGNKGLLAQQGPKVANMSDASLGTLSQATPGPDFWSWTPPEDTSNSYDVSLKPVSKATSHSKPTVLLMEQEDTEEFLTVPFQSALSQRKHGAPLPPLQSLVEIEKVDYSLSESPSADDHKHEEISSRNAAEATEALVTGAETPYGVNPDGSRWWKETGVEERPDGVVCRWTLNRGVSADGFVEWEDKYWEAAGQFDYKELGSEKSGRDASGNVWHEYWKEAMWQDFGNGILHLEKTADKWGKNGMGEEWQEKWWEHYDAAGQTEKWAHKWCSIDPKTPLEAGHAHVWHERWGEKYDGKGSSMKYTDKWAERSVGDGWAKWGDKWDEHFNMYGHGVKQGETWWEGEHGERWNRTWGEGHNGSGWIHKYGKGSSGEHWDTHVQEETWYERHPHYGFDHCFENSVQRPPRQL